jgi:flagellar hook-basal body complex protein FliE
MAASGIAPVGIGPALDMVCGPASGPGPDGPFGRIIDRFLREANARQSAADQAVMDLATGKTENIHEVMLAVTKADLTFRTFLQIRNRVTEAYQEITRMAV